MARMSGVHARGLTCRLPSVLWILLSLTNTIVASPDDLYWLSLTEQSIFFFDDVSQRLYLYPNSLTAYNEALFWNLSCAYKEFEPTTFDKPPLGSMYYQDAAAVASNGSIVWSQTVMTINPPNVFLRHQQSVYIQQKRALVVLGGYELWEANISTSMPSAAMLQSCMSMHGWVTNSTQCLVPHQETYILWLDNMTWTTLSYEAGGFPAVQNATLLAGGSLAMFQSRLSVTYDWVNDRLFAFGGYLDGLTFLYCGGSPFTYPVWVFSFQTKQWLALQTNNGLCVGYAQSIDPLRGVFVYNPLKNQLVSYSGTDNWLGFTSLYCYILDIATLTWFSSATCAPFTGPTPVFDATFFYNVDYSGVYVMGGQYDNPGYPGVVFWADPGFWFLDFQDYSWNIASLPTTLPPATQFSQMKAAVNSAAGVTYLWGGVMSTFSPANPWRFIFDYACFTTMGGFWRVSDNRATAPNKLFTIKLPVPVEGTGGVPVLVSGVYALLICIMFAGCCMGIYTLRAHQEDSGWTPEESQMELLFPSLSTSGAPTSAASPGRRLSRNQATFEDVAGQVGVVSRTVNSDGKIPSAASIYALARRRSTPTAWPARCGYRRVVGSMTFLAMTKGAFIISHALDIAFRLYNYSWLVRILCTMCLVMDAGAMSLALALSSSWPMRPPPASRKLLVYTLFTGSSTCVVIFGVLLATREDTDENGWPAIGWCLLGAFLLSSLLCGAHVVQMDIHSRLRRRGQSLLSELPAYRGTQPSMRSGAE